MRASVGVIVLLVCLPIAAPAQPDGREDVGLAKKYFDLGRELYERSDYRGALAQFEQAYALSRRPALLFNIARCYESLGEHAKAIDYYERFLPDSGENRSEVETRVTNLRRLVEERRAREHAPDAVTTPERPPPALPEAARAEPRPLRTAGWTLVGAGAAGLVAGTALAVLARSRQSTVETAAAEHKEWSAYEDTAAQGRSFRTGAIIGLTVGGAAAATGAVLLILDSRRAGREAGPKSATISPLFFPRGGGVAAGLRF